MSPDPIFFLDPHAGGLSKTLCSYLYNLPAFSKLRFIEDLHSQRNVQYLIHSGSSFPLHRLKFPHYLRRLCSYLEFHLWSLLNFKKIHSSITLNRLPPGSSIVINAQFLSDSQIKLLYHLDSLNFRIFVYYNHFHTQVELKSLLTTSLNNASFILNSPIHSPSKAILDSSKFRYLPFSLSNKYLSPVTPFPRSLKVLIVGSIVLKDEANACELIDQYSSSTLNPYRINFYLNHQKYPEVFCNIATVYDPTSLTTRNYFNIDLPDIYSKFTFFVCPEDVTGHCSSHMLEGMSRGCIYFLRDDTLYADIYKMIPFIHYIPYCGTIEDLVHVWNRIKADTNLLSFISSQSIVLASQYTEQSASDTFLTIINS